MLKSNKASVKKTTSRAPVKAPVKKQPAARPAPVKKPEPLPAPEPVNPMEQEVVGRVQLADNREVRVTRIPNGTTEDYIRIGINLLPNGENMSGAVFPESFLGDVIALLQEV